MDKLFALFFALVFLGCHNSEEINAINNLDTVTLIKYPLPKTADSLRAIIPDIRDDSNMVNVLLALGWSLRNQSTDSAIEISLSAYSLSERIGWTKGKAKATHSLGKYFSSVDENKKALEYFHSAITWYDSLEKSKDSSQIKYAWLKKADCFSRIGIIHHLLFNYSKAIDNYFNSLKYNEKCNNTSGVSNELGNIGIVYEEQGDQQKAMEYFNMALAIDISTHNLLNQTQHLGNIGIVYGEHKNFRKSLSYFFQTLKIDSLLGDEEYLSASMGNIGSAYLSLTDNILLNQKERNQLYDSAFLFFYQAVELNNRIGNLHGLANNLSNIAQAHFSLKNYKKAHQDIFEAFGICNQINALDLEAALYEKLSKLYGESSYPLPDSATGPMLGLEMMRIRAINYFKKHISIRDSLFSQENKKQLVRKEMNYEFDKKEAATKSDNDKKETLAKEELKQKETERNYFIAGFGLVLILAGFIFRSYRQKQKANEIISRQKLLVEEKQKEILDSIHYAKRIQQSMLPSEKYIHSKLNKYSK